MPPPSLSEFCLVILPLWLKLGRFSDCGQGPASCPLLTAGDGKKDRGWEVREDGGGERESLVSEEREIIFSEHPPCTAHLELPFPYVNFLTAPFIMRKPRLKEMEHHVGNHTIYKGPNLYYSPEMVKMLFCPLHT